MGIDFSSPPSSSSNSSSCSGLRSSAVGFFRTQQPLSVCVHLQMAALLPPDRAKVFLLLMSTPGHSFTLADVLEAVQLNRDFPSALKFLSHSCPICQEQVSFSQIITMTHCSCFLCQTCFKTFFSSAIKEKSIDLLVCPQCGKPEVKDPGRMEESMDYFNLLDTQIRHFLPPHIHELFQRKLRDRALQEMPNFRWCSHCSFGVLHEADRLRMDCPSCKKSTCSQCRSPWSPQHQGLSCQQFRLWQQQNKWTPPHTHAHMHARTPPTHAHTRTHTPLPHTHPPHTHAHPPHTHTTKNNLKIPSQIF
uniref:E3 ubiquitin-protein ligase RNF31-like n=1 Tax=Takifugu rubripes TaxID=31033 RepID=A0A674NH75_TAKRU